MVYFVGNNDAGFDTKQSALDVAVSMLDGGKAGDRVYISKDGKKYAWVELRVGYSDKALHRIFYTFRNKFGKPLDSKNRVIVYGTRWTKT